MKIVAGRDIVRPTFMEGEISEPMQGRIDMEHYKMTVERFPNFIPHPRRPSLAKRMGGWLLFILFFMLMAGFMAWGFIDGLERQIEIDRQIKSDRCASFGEDPTPEQQAYCEDLGV